MAYFVKTFTSIGNRFSESAMGTASDMSKNVLIVGGGYVGMYTALQLRKKMRRQLRTGEL